MLCEARGARSCRHLQSVRSSRPAPFIRRRLRSSRLKTRLLMMDTMVQLPRLKLIPRRPIIRSLPLLDLNGVSVACMFFFRRTQESAELVDC